MIDWYFAHEIAAVPCVASLGTRRNRRRKWVSCDRHHGDGSRIPASGEGGRPFPGRSVRAVDGRDSRWRWVEFVPGAMRLLTSCHSPERGFFPDRHHLAYKLQHGVDCDGILLGLPTTSGWRQPPADEEPSVLDMSRTRTRAQNQRFNIPSYDDPGNSDLELRGCDRKLFAAQEASTPNLHRCVCEDLVRAAFNLRVSPCPLPLVRNTQ